MRADAARQTGARPFVFTDMHWQGRDEIVAFLVEPGGLPATA